MTPQTVLFSESLAGMDIEVKDSRCWGLHVKPLAATRS